MYKLVIEFNDGRIEEHFFKTKEEVEEEVFFQWDEDVVFSIGRTDFPGLIYWVDRFSFGW